MYLTLVSTLRIDMQPLCQYMHLTDNQIQVSCVMKGLPNFKLTAQSAMSRFFSSREISDFYAAIQYLERLPTIKDCSSRKLVEVAEKGGSNCMKMALLAALAQENFHSEIKLVLCTITEKYEANPLIQCILQKYNLSALPSAACLLKYHEDFYAPFNNSQVDYAAVQSDIEITPMQIGSFTKRYCHHFIKHWLMIEKLHHQWTVEEIQQVQQECQQILETKNWESNLNQ